MKKFIGNLILVGCWIIGGVYAQEGPLQERLNSLKIAYITEQLSLTTEEAQQFWPIYNDYAAELEKLKEENDLMKAELKQKMLSADEQTLETLVDTYVQRQSQEQQLSERYHTRFKEVLPIRKVILLYKAQEEFKQKVFTELARRRFQQRNNRN